MVQALNNARQRLWRKVIGYSPQSTLQLVYDKDQEIGPPGGDLLFDASYVVRRIFATEPRDLEISGWILR